MYHKSALLLRGFKFFSTFMHLTVEWLIFLISKIMQNMSWSISDYIIMVSAFCCYEKLQKGPKSPKMRITIFWLLVSGLWFRGSEWKKLFQFFRKRFEKVLWSIPASCMCLHLLGPYADIQSVILLFYESPNIFALSYQLIIIFFNLSSVTNETLRGVQSLIV